LNETTVVSASRLKGWAPGDGATFSVSRITSVALGKVFIYVTVVRKW